MNTIPEKTLSALRWIITILERKNIPYQISGGFSAKLYGSTRPLNDIDIDIPDEYLAELLVEVSDYIIEDLKHYRDGKWDLDLMTLNYGGQEIDIGGAYNVQVSNQARTSWIPIPSDLSEARHFHVFDMSIQVIPPQKLIDYKQHLDGEHQLEDIEAVKNYISHELYLSQNVKGSIQT